jgi:hypothetical protein
VEDFGLFHAVEDSFDETEREVAVYVMQVVGLTGRFAVLAVDLLVWAEQDELAPWLEDAEPLSKDGLRIGVVFQ